MTTRRKSGPVPGPPELVRTVAIQIRVTADERADLLTIAEGWGIPLATAAYVMIAVYLAECRQGTVNLGHVGVKIAATSRRLAALGKQPNDMRLPKGDEQDE